MRILIFGAGASIPASYPAADALIPTIGEFVEEFSDSTLKRYWNRWDSWRRNNKSLKRIVFNPNPEVVLSLADLYETATKAADEAAMHTALEKWRSGKLTKAALRAYEKQWKDEGRKRLLKGGLARIGFIECLQRYFFYCHHRDASDRGLRDYLRRHFAHLSHGDVIVTLNWDTASERTLGEEGYWNPMMGYGFRKDLKMMPNGEPLPDMNVDSRVIVLKIHGSVGWHSSASGGIYFDNPRFLSEFGFHHDGNPLYLMDPEAPVGRPARDPILLYPSYLKQLADGTMQQIWHDASEALRQAERVDVYGYSLPESDLAVRTLFNVLRFRAEANSLRVLVHDPGKPSQERWRTLLGEKALGAGAAVHGRRIEEAPPPD
jgi:hypothetical protein